MEFSALNPYLEWKLLQLQEAVSLNNSFPSRKGTRNIGFMFII